MVAGAVTAPTGAMSGRPGVAAGCEGGLPEAFGGTGGVTGGQFHGPGVPGQSFPPEPNVQPVFDSPAGFTDALRRRGSGLALRSSPKRKSTSFSSTTSPSSTTAANCKAVKRCATRELIDLGVGFVSLTEALDPNTPTGQAMAKKCRRPGSRT